MRICTDARIHSLAVKLSTRSHIISWRTREKNNQEIYNQNSSTKQISKVNNLPPEKCQKPLPRICFHMKPLFNTLMVTKLLNCIGKKCQILSLILGKGNLSTAFQVSTSNINSWAHGFCCGFTLITSEFCASRSCGSRVGLGATVLEFWTQIQSMGDIRLVSLANITLVIGDNSASNKVCL